MNVRDAVIGVCAVMVDQSSIDVELINEGLEAASEYSPALKKPVAKVACAVLAGTLALSSIKEGDLTVSYNFDGIKTRLAYLSNLHGFTEFEPQAPTVSAPKLW